MSSIYLKPLFTKKKSDPLSLILRDIFKDNNYALSFIGALSLGIGVTYSNNISSNESIEEIIVTASKKEENIQDVPMSVQAVSAAELDKKNIYKSIKILNKKSFPHGFSISTQPG